MTSFEVINQGFGVTLQDLGRRGLQEYGVSRSGPMDLNAFLWANRLLENTPNTSVLEIPIGQFTLKSQITTYAVITGAHLNFTLNSKPQARYQIFKIQPNDILHWEHNIEGNYGYFSVVGGFESNAVLSSQSTNLRENIGSPVSLNTCLHCKQITTHSTCYFPQAFFPDYTSALTLRYLPVFQNEQFSEESKTKFESLWFKISRDINRTGFRLNAPCAIIAPFQNLISEAMLPGSIQILPSGDPIVMMRENPTIGGYPKIGKVLEIDLSKLAQRQPNTKVTFKQVSLSDAQTLKSEFDQFFKL